MILTSILIKYILFCLSAGLCGLAIVKLTLLFEPDENLPAIEVTVVSKQENELKRKIRMASLVFLRPGSEKKQKRLRA